MKQYITPLSIAVFVWGLILVAIAQLYPEYTRYYLYLSILVMIPIMIFNMEKQKKKDKLYGTTEFKASIYRMLFLALVLLAFFILNKQNYM